MLGARSWPRDCRSNLFQSQLMLVGSDAMQVETDKRRGHSQLTPAHRLGWTQLMLVETRVDCRSGRFPMQIVTLSTWRT